jgi:hypothetical protein
VCQKLDDLQMRLAGAFPFIAEHAYTSDKGITAPSAQEEAHTTGNYNSDSDGEGDRIGELPLPSTKGLEGGTGSARGGDAPPDTLEKKKKKGYGVGKLAKKAKKRLTGHTGTLDKDKDKDKDKHSHAHHAQHEEDSVSSGASRHTHAEDDEAGGKT